MKYYQEIMLLPGEEVPADFLWQKLYRQLHYGLVTLKAAGIAPLAVSFPDYDLDRKRCRLGLRMRLFSLDKSSLETFAAEGQFRALMDYVCIRPIEAVPPAVSYAAYIRRQGIGAKRSEEKNKRNRVLFEGKSRSGEISKAKKEFMEIPYSPLGLPFIWLNSDSTKKASIGSSCKFPLFIEKRKVESSGPGDAHGLSCYGLSSTACPIAVPEF